MQLCVELFNRTLARNSDHLPVSLNKDSPCKAHKPNKMTPIHKQTFILREYILFL